MYTVQCVDRGFLNAINRSTATQLIDTRGYLTITHMVTQWYLQLLFVLFAHAGFLVGGDFPSSFRPVSHNVYVFLMLFKNPVDCTEAVFDKRLWNRVKLLICIIVCVYIHVHVCVKKNIVTIQHKSCIIKGLYTT